MLVNIRIPRWVSTFSEERVYLHGFADASQAAYAAVVYLIPPENTTSPEPRLLVAKTRVAPVKTQTVPRLELCGAVLLSKLLNRVMREYGNRVAKIFAWSDSSVTLTWLRADLSLRWPVFVENRVAQVRQQIPGVKWRYVLSEENPADLATRGIDPKQLIDKTIWWSGPQWLTGPEVAWPPELNCLAVSEESLPAELQHAPADNEDIDFTTRFSGLSILIRTVARCLRFKYLLRPGGKEEMASPLSVMELKKAWIACILYVQRRQFSSEIEILQRGHPVGKRNPLRDLDPFTTQVMSLGSPRN